MAPSGSAGSAAAPVAEFSVIMPAFNAAGTVAEAIRSVQRQSVSDWELIVIDDGSTDATAGIVRGFLADARIRLVSTENRGAAAARNEGLASASGRSVAFIDSDDLWMPTFLAGMRDALAERPDAGLVYTDAWTVDRPSGRVGAVSAMHWQRPPLPPPSDPEAFLIELLERNFIYTATVVPVEVLGRVGPFRESLAAAIDYEMWLRILAHGYPACRSRGLLAVYSRGRAGSISSDRARVYASLGAVYRVAASEHPLSPEMRVRALARARAVDAELAALAGSGGLAAGWRRTVRPGLIRARNAVLRRDGWLAAPPAEVAAAFPTIVRPAG
jgi:glycosyltransferase involved in cell wall biosynthesis